MKRKIIKKQNSTWLSFSSVGPETTTAITVQNKKTRRNEADSLKEEQKKALKMDCLSHS